MTTIYALFTEQVIDAREALILTMDNNINAEETYLDALAEIDWYLLQHNYTAHIKGFRIEIEGFGETIIKQEGC